MLDLTKQLRVTMLVASFNIAIHGFSAIAPCIALPPASLQSWIPAIPAGMTDRRVPKHLCMLDLGG
jgi:hypothetical protein